MARTRFIPDSAGLQEVAVSDEMAAAMLAAAEEGRTVAEGFAADFTVTGEYAEHFNTFTRIVPLITSFGGHEVAAGILANDSEHAAAVEYGNARDRKPHFVLSRTAAALHAG